MVRDAEKYQKEDENQKAQITAKNALEAYAYHIKQTVDDPKIQVPETDKKQILAKCNEAITWLDSHPVSVHV